MINLYAKLVSLSNFFLFFCEKPLMPVRLISFLAKELDLRHIFTPGLVVYAPALARIATQLSMIGS